MVKTLIHINSKPNQWGDLVYQNTSHTPADIVYQNPSHNPPQTLYHPNP